MRRNLTLTEELNRMRGLMIYENGDYKNPIIKEDVETSGLNFKKKINFAPGWYTQTDKAYKGSGYKWNLNEDLSEELNRIKEFLLNNPTGYIVDITMSAGESQIPNTDNTTEGAGKPVDSGYLSRERLNTIEVHMKNVLEEWKTEGINTENIKIKKCYGKNCGENELDAVGPTTWVGQEFCPDNEKREKDPDGYNCTTDYKNGLKLKKYGDLKQKYDEEQFLDVSMSVKKIEELESPKKDPLECAANLKIRIWVPSHKCQNAEFFVFANKKLLKNSVGGSTVNLNNTSADRGVPRSDSEPIFQAEVLNPGYGYLPNGDGTFSSYSYKTENKKGDVGGGRSDTFTITEQEVKNIINSNTNEENKSKISIWMIATTSNAHKDIPNVTITMDGKEIYNEIPNVVKGKLLTIDVCTKEVTAGTDDSTPDLSTQINKIVRQKRKLQEELFNSGRVTKRKQIKLDKKAIVLDRTETLVDKITSLLKYLLTNKDSLSSEDVRNRLITDYNTFLKELKGDKEKGEPTLLGKLENKIMIYDDKVIRNHNLYGDVRGDLNKFYLAFNKIYRRHNQYWPGGIPNSKKDKTLDVEVLNKRLENKELLSHFGLKIT
jgi:hypothetical protein